jgi:hypothetical protein
MIDSAAFILTLDDCAFTEPNDITKNFLHGDGINRYYTRLTGLALIAPQTPPIICHIFQIIHFLLKIYMFYYYSGTCLI